MIARKNQSALVFNFGFCVVGLIRYRRVLAEQSPVRIGT